MNHPKEFAEGLSIGIIMDGNGRWAKNRGLPRTAGHKKGAAVFQDIANYCEELGVSSVYFYAFSTENWNRPADEVAALMGLVLSSLEDEIFMKNNVRFRVIGDIGRLPQEVQDKLRQTEEHTAANTAMTMVVALSYSARWELAKAARQIAVDAIEGRIDPASITDTDIEARLETRFMPDPDLLIRTGGELRISNFLLWQIAYSELYFCDTYWPDFDEAALRQAIASYQGRQRRFGKTEAQVEGDEH